ncbi:hypothetical protein ACFCX0_45435 [Streptomyces sp. NPDC056352]|uniref:hypothetical protein n=1 Tax=Streptomyces sp. NPDC056352 TaxID=3345791 RepID=UPI0035D74A70
MVVHARARFGFRAGAGTSDDPRRRLITARLSGTVARRNGGQRAHGLQVVLDDIGFIDFALL